MLTFMYRRQAPSQGIASPYLISNGSAFFFPRTPHIFPLRPYKSGLTGMTTDRKMRTVEMLAISQHPVYIKRLTMPLNMAGQDALLGVDLCVITLPRRVRHGLTSVHSLSFCIHASMTGTPTHCQQGVRSLTDWAAGTRVDGPSWRAVLMTVGYLNWCVLKYISLHLSAFKRAPKGLDGG